MDRANVVFFEVTDSIISTLYFAINDPGVDNVAPDLGTTGTTTYYLEGGTGTTSDSRSWKYQYTDIEIGDGDPIVGTILDTRSHGNDSLGWVYFQGVSPSQGEHIGDKYYFKVVAGVDTNVSKNAYQLWVSYGNSGTPTGVTGMRSFAYSWCLALQNLSNNYEIYPFVPEGATGYIVHANWDFDWGADNYPTAPYINTSGTAYNKSNAVSKATALTPAITESLNSEVENTSYQITGGETNGTWKAKYNEGPYLSPGTSGSNIGEFWFWNSATSVNDNSSYPPSDAAVYRAYSSYYAPPSPDHVVLSYDDGIAISNGVDAETIVLHIADSAGQCICNNRWYRDCDDKNHRFNGGICYHISVCKRKYHARHRGR